MIAAGHLIYSLDDVSRRWYMNLKAKEEALTRIYLAIKCKKKLAMTLTEEWLEYEKMELDDDADMAYLQKCKLDAEIADLERQKKTLERKIGNASKKA